jgi:TRAP-type C4-dicarboxylate transport system permease small subunit
MPIIETLDRGVMAVLRAAVVLAVIVIFVLLLLGVLVRAVPLFSMAGYDEIVELLVAWAVFLGAVVLWREGGHFRVEFLQRSLAHRPAWMVEGVAYAAALAFALVFSYQSYHFVVGTTEMTAFFAISKTAWYASMPVAGALMVWAALADLWRWARR